MMRSLLVVLLVTSCAAPADFGPMPTPNSTTAEVQTPHGKTVCFDGGATETCYRITVTPK